MTKHSLTRALIVGAALAAGAAGAAEIKIGYVNFRILLAESPHARTAEDTLKGEFLPKQRDLGNQQKALQEKADKLKKEAAVMSEADRGKAEREVRDLELNLQRRYNEMQEDMTMRRNEVLAAMQQALIQEVQAYAKANGYQLVVSEGVIFATDAVDITPQVVAALKAKSPAPAAATPPRT